MMMGRERERAKESTEADGCHMDNVYEREKRGE